MTEDEVIGLCRKLCEAGIQHLIFRHAQRPRDKVARDVRR
jgi:hypothetical protein